MSTGQTPFFISGFGPKRRRPRCSILQRPGVLRTWRPHRRTVEADPLPTPSDHAHLILELLNPFEAHEEDDIPPGVRGLLGSGLEHQLISVDLEKANEVLADKM